jgi:TRAP-type C4-dicarboxylate transport system permease small subunit
MVLTHTPNHIPKSARITYIVFSLFMFAYGSYGVWVNDLYLPSKRSRGMHLHDTPAWVMYGAILCACLVMLSVVIDHYDRRNNERHYRLFADVFKYIGWGLFGFSLLMAIIRRAHGG